MVVLGTIAVWKLTAFGLALTTASLTHTIATGKYTIDQKKDLKEQARRRQTRMQKMQEEIATAQALERQYLDLANTENKKS